MDDGVKLKEQKLEQDFQKLMQRYNRSKQMIDDLYSSKKDNDIKNKSMLKKSMDQTSIINNDKTKEKDKYIK